MYGNTANISGSGNTYSPTTSNILSSAFVAMLMLYIQTTYRLHPEAVRLIKMQGALQFIQCLGAQICCRLCIRFILLLRWSLLKADCSPAISNPTSLTHSPLIFLSPILWSHSQSSGFYYIQKKVYKYVQIISLRLSPSLVQQMNVSLINDPAFHFRHPYWNSFPYPCY